MDDTVRFVNEDTVIAVVEENSKDENYELLQRNLKDLKKMRLLNGKQLNIVEPEKEKFRNCLLQFLLSIILSNPFFFRLTL